MSAQRSTTIASTVGPTVYPDYGSKNSQEGSDDKYPKVSTPPTPAALATRQTERMEAVIGDAILRFLKIRKGQKGDEYDLDTVCTNS
jgi:hypothetical protein